MSDSFLNREFTGMLKTIKRNVKIMFNIDVDFLRGEKCLMGELQLFDADATDLFEVRKSL